MIFLFLFGVESKCECALIDHDVMSACRQCTRSPSYCVGKIVCRMSGQMTYRMHVSIPSLIPITQLSVGSYTKL